MEAESGAEMAEYFSITENNTILAIVPFSDEEVDKYLYTGAWNQNDVQKWIQTFLDGGLEKHYKSEDIPAEDNSPVKTIVGQNFEQVTHNPNAHVLVEFYAPWCHHCKKVRVNLFIQHSNSISFRRST